MKLTESYGFNLHFLCGAFLVIKGELGQSEKSIVADELRRQG